MRYQLELTIQLLQIPQITEKQEKLKLNAPPLLLRTLQITEMRLFLRLKVLQITETRGGGLRDAEPTNHGNANVFAVECPTNQGNASRGHRWGVCVICKVLLLGVARRKELFP